MQSQRMAGAKLESAVGAAVAALMKHSDEYSKSEALAKKVGVSKSTIQRLRQGDVSARIDTIARVAKVFGLQSWQLLVPDFDPAHPPMLQMDARQKEFYRKVTSLQRAAEEIADYVTDGKP